MKPIGWGSFVRCSFCLLAALAWPHAAAQNTPLIAFDTAQFAHTGTIEPPPPGASWESVTLPDSWRAQQRDRGKIGWYRMEFNLAVVPSIPQAVYIARITNNIALYANGSLVGVSGDIARREASWNTAQFFSIPPGLLHAGRNTLEIRLHPDNYARAGISSVLLDDATDISATYQWRHFLQKTAPEFITALLGVMAAFSLAIWAGRRKEVMFGFFSLMCITAMLRLAHFYIRDPVVPLLYITDASICWMMALTTSFMLHFAGRPAPRFERFMYHFAAIATAALWLTPWSWHGIISNVVFALLALISFVMLTIVGRALFGSLSFANIVMFIGLVLNVALGIHDFLNFQELLGFDHLYLLPLGLPLVLLAVAALVVERFVATLHKYEGLNADLAASVQVRERDLTASYERLRLLDQQRATAEERQRLMRDMHDGVGSYLMSTLALARMGALTQHEMQEVLADCIDELKITIDSLEPVESDLLVVLGNLRYRLEPRLNMAGISLEWSVSDLPPLAYLDPENTRSILRIVQEAFTNTLKHANAHRITLSTGVDYANARVWVRVTDDGKGFKSDQSAGRGLQNMQIRAAKLNGMVEVLPLRGGGTCMNLYLPLAKII